MLLGKDQNCFKLSTCFYCTLLFLAICVLCRGRALHSQRMERASAFLWYQRGTHRCFLGSIDIHHISLPVVIVSQRSNSCSSCNGTRQMEYETKRSDLSAPERLSLRECTANWKSFEPQWFLGIAGSSKCSLKLTVGIGIHNTSALPQVLRIPTGFLAECELLRRASKIRVDLLSWIDFHINPNKAFSEQRLQS